MSIGDRNNSAGRLIAKGKLDEAERVLDRVEKDLGRPPEPMDEYFYRVHRVVIAWHRARYDEALPHAQRAYALELELLENESAFGAGSWAIISVLTRLRRFDEARAIFEAVVEDDSAFSARCGNNRESAEKILVAGMCIFFESKDFAPHSALVRRAKTLMSPDSANLVYAYACFHALTGDANEAFDELRRAFERGQDVEAVLVDDDWRALLGDPRWEEIAVSRAKTWKIGSQPSGAKIIIDGKDTGEVTPARVRPPGRGVHRVRFVLEGHADEEVEIEAENLDLSRRLEPLAAIAERERMKEDGLRPPSEAARAKTRTFIGNVRKARIIVDRNTTYALGGLRIEIRGDGTAHFHKQKFFPKDKEHRLSTTLDAKRVFEAFVEEAFTEMVIAPHTGVADELYVSITLEGAGGRHEHGKFIGAPHERFARLVEIVRQTAARAVDQATRERLTL